MENKWSSPVATANRWLLAVLLICGMQIASPALQAQDDSSDDTVPVSKSTESNAATADPAEQLDAVFSGRENPTFEQLRLIQQHAADLVERLRPATVGVQVGQAQGSGVIVSRRGFVLTAAHVIGAPNLPATIKLPDGRELRAVTLGVNSQFDSGMLQIKTEEEFPYLSIGESSDLTKGQWVLALGHPGGFDKQRQPVVRLGRVLHERIQRNTLRTDCTLVGGDSGGPLFDMNGEVVGIHSRIANALHENYHVAIDAYSDGWDDLQNSQRINSRGERVGVTMGIDLADDTSGGLKIERVADNSNADKDGLKAGDIIVTADKQKLADSDDLRKVLRRKRPGQSIKLIIRRIGEESSDAEEIELELKFRR